VHKSKSLLLACLLPLFVFADASTERAPDFTRVDATGQKVRLSKYKGKVVLVECWATWCTGCK
jgi:thiol-disulfide isomerase/thioredoxin